MKWEIGKTWIDPEEKAYGKRRGVFRRNGLAILCKNPYRSGLPDLPYGSLVKFQANVPDTFSTIPARYTFKGKTIRCYMRVGDSGFEILPEGNLEFPLYDCPVCNRSSSMNFKEDNYSVKGHRVFDCTECGYSAEEVLLESHL